MSEQPKDLVDQRFQTFLRRELAGASVLSQGATEQLRMAFFAGAATVNALYVDAMTVDAKTFARLEPGQPRPVMRELHDCGRRIHAELDRYVRSRMGGK